jgi:hypothetical protein
MDGSIGRQPLDSELCELVWSLVQQARTAFISRREDGGYMRPDWRPPELSYFDSGLPRLTQKTGFASGTVDFDGVFNVGGGSDTIDVRQLDGWAPLLRYCEGNEELRRSFLVKEVQEPGSRAEDFFHYDVWSIPGSVFDRLMRLCGDSFTYADFLEVYLEIEAGHLREDLSFAVIVPVVLTLFEEDAFRIAPNLGLRRLSGPEQLARISEYAAVSSPANELVVGAATHALILVGYAAPNFCGDSYPPYDRPGWWPTEPIDRFFDALRVVTGVDTGYAQLCMLPLEGWAQTYRLGLPPLVLGPQVRRYPEYFDDFGWLRDDVAPISGQALSEVGDLYRALGERPRLSLAARRLSAAMLRTDDQDKILDLLIGLEALLGDEAKSEMTYKLALRTAAVLAATGDFDPALVFADVKRLYAYRSAVAHGDAERARKRRTIRRPDGLEHSAIDLAARYLRQTIRFLSMREDLDDPGEIDARLLLSPLVRQEAGTAGEVDAQAGRPT